MATDQDLVDFMMEQMADAGVMSCRKMFGEYALYCDAKVIGLVCNNQLFIKPTAGGRAFIGDVVEGFAYQGAKPSLLIEDKFEDREWISELVRITCAELPLPKPKKKKATHG